MARDELDEVLRSLDGVFDGEEQVDELSHALQCARNAQLADARPALLTAAIFHDVGRSPLVAGIFPGLPHEAAAAAWLQPRFGEEVAWLAGAHVAAKIYLLENEPGYGERLSAESSASARRQATVALDAFVRHRWWDDALELRRWDDAAKADIPRPDLQALLVLVRPLQLS